MPTLRSVVVVSLLTSGSALALPSLRGREVCMPDGADQLVCIRLDDPVAAARMRQLTQELQQLLQQLGLDAGAGFLTGCGGAKSKLPTVTLTDVPGKHDKRAPKTPEEAQALISAASQCARQKLSQFGGRKPPAPAGSDWVSQTVSRIDGEMAQCRDSDTGQIAEGDSQEAKKPEPPKNQSAKDKHKVVGVLPQPDQAPPASTAPSASTGDPNQSQLLLTPSEQKKKSDAAELDALVAAYKAIVGNGDPKQVDAGALWAFEKYVGPDKWTQITQRAGGARQPCREGADCQPSCGDLQQAWGQFKAWCEQSHWQAFRCSEFLRRANGCVSTTIMLTSPDQDDATCPAGARDDAAGKRMAWKVACEKKKMIMMPVDSTTVLCVERSVLQQGVPRRIDPCTDPRAMPGPDDCPGGTSGLPPAGGPTPQPPGPPAHPR